MECSSSYDVTNMLLSMIQDSPKIIREKLTFQPHSDFCYSVFVSVSLFIAYHVSC